MIGIAPEDQDPASVPLIHNPPTERTATALLQLLELTAGTLDVPAAQLSQARGAICKDGVVGIFALLTHEGSQTVDSWVVSFYNATEADEDTKRVNFVQGGTPAQARELFDVLEGKLNA